MVDNTGKIELYNLTLGLKKENVKTFEQKKLFSIFDLNNNNVIDQNEFECYKSNFKNENITQKQADDYIKNHEQVLINLGLKPDAFKLINMKTEELKKLGYIVMEDINGSGRTLFGNKGLLISYDKNRFSNEEEITISRYDPNNKNLDLTEVYSPDGKIKQEIIRDTKLKKDIKRIYYRVDGTFQFEPLQAKQPQQEIPEAAQEIATKLRNDIYALNEYGLPTTGKNFGQHINLINKDNIRDVLKAYNGNLIDDIIGEIGLRSKRAQYLKQIFSIALAARNIDRDGSGCAQYVKNDADFEIDEIIDSINPFPDTKKLNLFLNLILNAKELKFYTYSDIEPRIFNKHYIGDEFEVVDNDDIVTLTNKRTKETVNLDLNKLFSDFPPEQAYLMKFEFKHLPAEVLFDIYHEATFNSSPILGHSDNTKGLYIGGHNKDFIQLKDFKNIDPVILCHELGHAIEDINTHHSFAENSNYKKVFEEELEAYKKAGHLQYNEALDNMKDGEYWIYATKDISEMFAECYTLLMLGEYDRESTSNELILKYFPKTLQNVKEWIEVVRVGISQELRHKID